ncbi:MAG: SDR family oxidoreductase [Spongiibacteraceae bacterium]
MEINGKVAIVTGASAGIGEAIARLLSAAGVKLVLTARRQDRLEALAESLPGPAAILAADIANRDTAPRLLALALEQFGQADILVNNAGLLASRPLEDVDLDGLSQLISVNFDAVVRLSYTFARHFKPQGCGAIINVTSIGAFMTVPYAGVYSGVKAGVESFTAALRIELGGTGVKVGTIAPGSTATEILDAARANGEQPWSQEITELQPIDVAEAVRFMLEQPDRANIARMHIYAAGEGA